MAEDKKSILVYADWIGIFDELADDEAGKLIKHFFRYVNDMNPEAPDRLTKLLFAPIKQTLKRDLVKYETKREINRKNALLRWDKENANACERMPSDANHADSDSVSDSVSVNDKERNIIPPPVHLIAKYCKKRNNEIDAEYFYDWYQTRGWKVGKDKMKDWQAAIRTWEQRNKNKDTRLIMP